MPRIHKHTIEMSKDKDYYDKFGNYLIENGVVYYKGVELLRWSDDVVIINWFPNNNVPDLRVMKEFNALTVPMKYFYSDIKIRKSEKFLFRKDEDTFKQVNSHWITVDNKDLFVIYPTPYYGYFWSKSNTAYRWNPTEDEVNNILLDKDVKLLPSCIATRVDQEFIDTIKYKWSKIPRETYNISDARKYEGKIYARGIVYPPYNTFFSRFSLDKEWHEIRMLEHDYSYFFNRDGTTIDTSNMCCLFASELLKGNIPEAVDEIRHLSYYHMNDILGVFTWRDETLGIHSTLPFEKGVLSKELYKEFIKHLKVLAFEESGNIPLREFISKFVEILEEKKEEIMK